MNSRTEKLYQIIAEVNDVKYEIVANGVGLFGESLYQACTFQIEMRPQGIRRVIGTFRNRAEAETCIRHHLAKP